MSRFKKGVDKIIKTEEQIADRDKEVYYPKAIFNTISEYRQKQIESLGINNKQI